MTTNKDALERATELLNRIDIQCKAIGHPVGGIEELKFIISQALQTQAELVEALKFYADVSNWDTDKGYDTISDLPAVADWGNRAKKALARAEGIE